MQICCASSESDQRVFEIGSSVTYLSTRSDFTTPVRLEDEKGEERRGEERREERGKRRDIINK